MLQAWGTAGSWGSDARRGALPRRQADRHAQEVVTAAAAALDSLNCGVALIDTARRVRFMNRLGRLLCNRRDGLRLQHDRLSAASPSDAARLNAALGRIRAGTAGAALRLGSCGERPMFVMVKSLPSESSLPEPAGGPHPSPVTALLLFNDPSRLPPIPRERLMQAYGLTATEASFTSLLLQGHTSGEIAQQLGIRLATARTHLRAVLAKTGTHRQSELVWCLLQEVGLVV